MINMENNRDKKNKIIALSSSVGVHVLIVLILLFSAFKTPLPLPGEEGVEVNLGTSDQGFGLVQPAHLQAQSAQEAYQQSSGSDNEYVTTDEETVAIEQPKPKDKDKAQPETPKKEVTKAVEPEPQPVVNPNALYKGKQSTQGSSEGGSQGIAGGVGDQGSIYGTPGSDNYVGTGGRGSGSGISYELGGRGATSLPKPVYNSREQGKIVVAIKVNKNGVVTHAAAGARGTTISEITLRRNAEEAAKRTKFAPDPNAPEEQRGTITYVFVKTN
ncbi:MAG: TonB family protein [Lentimicrobiaceae bacterium]|nr:TonB family protein [Lentimicrobiaceae bacterium]